MNGDDTSAGRSGGRAAAPVAERNGVERGLLGDPSVAFADRSPIALPRDNSGRQQAHNYIYELPTPPEQMLGKVYGPAVEAIRRVLPLRAARLEDLMRRVDESLVRFRAVRAEEEERKHVELQRLQESRDRLSEELDALRHDLETTREQTDGVIHARFEDWAKARQTAAWIYAAADEPFPHPTDEELADTLEFMPTTESVAARVEVEEAKVKAQSRLQRLMASVGIGRNEPEADVRVAEPLPPAGPANGATPTPLPGTAAAPASNVPVRGGMRQILNRLNPLARHEAAAGTSYVDTRPEYDAMAEARKQVRTVEAIAAEEGLPFPSAAECACDGKTHMVARWLAMVALGAIFGLSIGLITGLFKTRDLSEDPVKGLVALVCVVLGIFAFWGMGRLAAMLAGLAAEGVMHDAFSEDTQAKMRRHAWWAFKALLFIGIALIAVEACVEFKGIIGSLMRDAADNAARGGVLNGSSSGPAPAETNPLSAAAVGTFLVCLVVSGPFILFHITEAWIEVRASAIHNRLHALHEAEVCRRADVLRREYDAAFPPFAKPAIDAAAAGATLTAAGGSAAPFTSPAAPIASLPAPESATNGHSGNGNGNGAGNGVGNGARGGGEEMPALQPAGAPTSPVAEGQPVIPTGHDAVPLGAPRLMAAPSEAVTPMPAASDEGTAHDAPLSEPPLAAVAAASAGVSPAPAATHLDFDLPGFGEPVSPLHVAVARERVFQAARRLKEARADQYAALKPLRQRIEDTEQERSALKEDPAKDAVACRRVEDAYADYVGGTRVFDEEYRQMLDMVEQVTRRRAVRNWWKRLLRRAAGDSTEDMDASVSVIGLKAP